MLAVEFDLYKCDDKADEHAPYKAGQTGNKALPIDTAEADEQTDARDDEIQACASVHNEFLLNPLSGLSALRERSTRRVQKPHALIRKE